MYTTGRGGPLYSIIHPLSVWISPRCPIIIEVQAFFVFILNDHFDSSANRKAHFLFYGRRLFRRDCIVLIPWVDELHQLMKVHHCAIYIYLKGLSWMSQEPARCGNFNSMTAQISSNITQLNLILNTYEQCQKPCSKWPKVNGNQADKRGSLKHPEIKWTFPIQQTMRARESFDTAQE